MKAWNHLSEQRVPFAVFKVSFALSFKSFCPPSILIVCWPVPSRLKYTFGELFVKVIIEGWWCIYSPRLQSSCSHPITLSDPGTCMSRVRHILYKTDRKLNTGCYMDTLSHTRTVTLYCILSQGETWTSYICISMHLADLYIKAILD